jgi:glutamine amidotransferase
MHLMATKSFELGNNDGLNLIPGRVEPHDNGSTQIGWRPLVFRRPSEIFSTFEAQEFYFNNSYRFVTENKYIFATVGNSGGNVAAVKNGTALGLQFHPEKSQNIGTAFLSRAIESLDSG